MERTPDHISIWFWTRSDPDVPVGVRTGGSTVITENWVCNLLFLVHRHRSIYCLPGNAFCYFPEHYLRYRGLRPTQYHHQPDSLYACFSCDDFRSLMPGKKVVIGLGTRLSMRLPGVLRHALVSVMRQSK
jgi:hypothetical protein